MLELSQKKLTSTANQADDPSFKNLDHIETLLIKLTNKYTPIATKYEQPSRIKPDYTDLKDINKDLQEFLFYESLYPPQEVSAYCIAYLFLKNIIFFKALSYSVLKQLLLRHDIAKAAAISIFGKSSCYDKASLLKTITHFQTKQKLPHYNDLAEDQAFIFFLLSQPKHAAFFNLNELIECLTEANGQISPYIYKLILSFSHLLTNWPTYFDTLTTTNAPTLIAAMAPLTTTELASLLPNNKANSHLVTLLNDEQATTEAILQNWPSAHIQWLISQLCPAEETSKNFVPLAQNALGKIMEGLFLTPRSDLNKEFANHIKQKAVLENIPRKYLESCLQIQPHDMPHLAEKQQSLILAVANYPALFPASDRAFFHLLCLKANSTTFTRLSEKENFQIHFSHTTAHLQASSLYQLISETHEEDKVAAILTGAKAHLHSLSSAELLTLATNIPKGQKAPILSSEDLNKILKKRSVDFYNNSTDQFSLNLVMDITLRNRKMSRDLFQILMTHSDFQEAWLRSKIFDVSWQTLGQGFFSKKVPTTIAKARSFLHNEGARITPLSPQSLNKLIKMFKDAQTTSHKYYYGFGTINLRDKNTQSFYNQVAQFPYNTDPLLENMGLVQL